MHPSNVHVVPAKPLTHPRMQPSSSASPAGPLSRAATTARACTPTQPRCLPRRTSRTIVRGHTLAQAQQSHSRSARACSPLAARPDAPSVLARVVTCAHAARAVRQLPHFLSPSDARLAHLLLSSPHKASVARLTIARRDSTLLTSPRASTSPGAATFASSVLTVKFYSPRRPLRGCAQLDNTSISCPCAPASSRGELAPILPSPLPLSPFSPAQHALPGVVRAAQRGQQAWRGCVAVQRVARARLDVARACNSLARPRRSLSCPCVLRNTGSWSCCRALGRVCHALGFPRDTFTNRHTKISNPQSRSRHPHPCQRVIGVPTTSVYP
jgi:hypothetical protein